MAADKRPAGRRDVYLVVDTRERAVIPFIEDGLMEFEHLVRQINTGDYLVCRRPPRAAGAGPAGGPPAGEPQVLAAFERKTYEDFAASFRDERYRNLDKMLALRRATGCQLYYLIEGPAFPNPNRRFGRIPYENILAAITKLSARDGVFIVQTADQAHTAKRLGDFLRVFENEVPYTLGAGTAGLAAATGGAGDAKAPLAGDARAPPPAGEPPDVKAPAGARAPLAVPAELTCRIEETDAEAAVKAWARLKGVSIVMGKLLTRQFSVADLAARRVTLEQLRALRTATGRALSRDAAASLLAVRSGEEAAAVRVVSGLRGVTPPVAAELLEAAGGLAGLCAAPLARLEAVTLAQKTRRARLGRPRAERILRILRYVEVAATAAASAEDVPAAATAVTAATAADEGSDDEAEPAALADSDIDALLE